ncbi:ATP-binding protein [Aestuariibaculum sediminum]|uniref:ATP-binding protein n=1 Tax=Aestuariibaculum sediminum TaxID=2770637 RepID=A0A8J6Q3A9_9FLAO|nr:ATP-binding protein [Aestuariibaculum sediminum]MBD0833359.1 ATP-binding protein [Aestuariibaculum sediminum]
MTNYDFSTLNSLDFEKLACDLLNHEYKQNSLYAFFRSFKPGKDLGIDLLHSTIENEYDIVVQVKHYVKTSYSTLKSDLIKKEKPKVDKLKPRLYILVTSSELNPQQKKEIKEIFHPYIPSLNEIYGRDDLNGILRLNSAIEENHFKLWFSSFVVLNKILNYKFDGRRKEFTENVLKNKLRLFVVTRDFYLAKNTLEKNKFLILTGEPGVGKTTLSDMLIYNYIKNDYEVNIVYESIKEIEDTLRLDDSKQIFYFDDFLGHTYAEIYKSKSAESMLIKIINRIENSKNKLLILNTRKFILASFLEDSERLREFNPLRAEAKVELLSYSYGAKRRMLDNHLLESGLNEEQLRVIKELAPFICNHSNFMPRIIEFFTGSKVLKLLPKDYESFIKDNLKNPKQIWNHAYSNQITDYDRFLLNTLFSFGREVENLVLERAYNRRIKFEVENNNFKKPIDSFKASLRKLKDGFINISTTREVRIGFINPSLEDFLNYYIRENEVEIERILSSSILIEQWYNFYKPYKNAKDDLNSDLLEIFIKFLVTVINQNESEEDIFLVIVFYSYFFEKISLEYFTKLLNKIKTWQFLKNNILSHHYSMKLLFDLKSDKKLSVLISNLPNEFFLNTLLNLDNIDDIIELNRMLLKHYEVDLFKSLKVENCVLSLSVLKKEIIKIFERELSHAYERLMEATEKNTHIEIIQRINDNYDYIKVNLFNDFFINYDFLCSPDWNRIFENNLIEQEVRGYKISNVDFDPDVYDINLEVYEDYDKDYQYELPNPEISDRVFDIGHDDTLPF